MYEKTRPSSATLVTERLTDALVDSVRRVPGVADAEARPVVMARMRRGSEEWTPGVLFVVRDFERQRMDLVVRERGPWPPSADDILLERSALQVAKARVGDSITVRTPGGDDRRVRIAGTLHAAGLAPAWMEHMVPAFVAWDSPLRGVARGESEQLRITVAEHPLDEGWIREVADSVKTMLERQGHAVSRVTVPPPGQHPHAGQMAAFLYLIGAFGALSLLLGSVLTASMVHALLTEQLKQVGIMKAIGASTRQVAGVYLAQVALLALGALAIGVPAGIALGRMYAGFSAGILNADVTHTAFPFGVVAAEIVAGLLVPLLVAMVPVLRASRITVREALGDDFGAQPFGTRRFERLARAPCAGFRGRSCSRCAARSCGAGGWYSRWRRSRSEARRSSRRSTWPRAGTMPCAATLPIAATTSPCSSPTPRRSRRSSACCAACRKWNAPSTGRARART